MVLISNYREVLKVILEDTVIFNFYFFHIRILFRDRMLERDHQIRASHDAQLFHAAHAQQLQQQEEALKRLTRP